MLMQNKEVPAALSLSVLTSSCPGALHCLFVFPLVVQLQKPRWDEECFPL